VKRIAIGDVSSARIRMFVDEAKVSVLLDHPNIVRVYDIACEDGFLYMVMEYLRGWDVEQLVALSPAPMPLRAVMRLAIDACNGLAGVHAATDATGGPLGLVHRDVSPSNLFVTDAGLLKILDFGVAKSVLQEGRTSTGIVKGKAAYMSPEQCRGDAVDVRSDLFSLGIVLHELLTGARLFEAETIADAMEAVQHRFIPPPQRDDAALPDELVAVVMRALQRDRRMRHQTAEELARDLRAVERALGPVDAHYVAAIAQGLRGGAVESKRAAGASGAHLASWSNEVTAALRPQGAGTGSTRRRPSRSVAMLGIAVALFVAVGLVRGVVYRTPDDPPASPTPVAPIAAPAPAPEPVPVPEPPAAALPSTELEAVRAPRLPSSSPARPQHPKVAHDPPKQTHPPLRNGRLTLRTSREARVFVGTRLLGITPLVEHELPAGHIVLRLVDTHSDAQMYYTLSITPGDTVEATVKFD
jgi:hypothetical protein